MAHNLEELRIRSGLPNPGFDINRVSDGRERFVHHLRVPGHPEVEVHLPIEWVSIDGTGEVVFNTEGASFLNEARELVSKF